MELLICSTVQYAVCRVQQPHFNQRLCLFKTVMFNYYISDMHSTTCCCQVSSVVQVVGLVICLHGAAKISHKSQGIASLASRWHALVTCSSSNNETTHGTHRVPSTGNLAAFPASLLTMDFSESDFESVDSGPVQNNAQLAYNMSSYHKREALGEFYILLLRFQIKILSEVMVICILHNYTMVRVMDSYLQI